MYRSSRLLENKNLTKIIYIKIIMAIKLSCVHKTYSLLLVVILWGFNFGWIRRKHITGLRSTEKKYTEREYASPYTGKTHSQALLFLSKLQCSEDYYYTQVFNKKREIVWFARAPTEMRLRLFVKAEILFT